MVHRLYAASGLYIDALADTTPLTQAYTPRRLNPRRGIPRVFRLVMQGLSALMRLHPPTAASSRYAVPYSGRALMRWTDVPTQRRPRHRQVSQGMRVGKGRTAADATSVGVGAIEVLHPSPGPSIAHPKPNKQNENPDPTTEQPLPSYPSFPTQPAPESLPPNRGGIHPRGVRWDGRPPPRHAKSPNLPVFPLQASFNQNSYEFNQCSIKHLTPSHPLDTHSASQ